MRNPELELLTDHADIIKALCYNEILSTGEVSNLIGKSIPHVNKLLLELKNKGIIIERGLASSSGGRKPLTYSIVADLYFTISVALDRFSIQLGVLDMRNDFIGEIINDKIELNTINAETIIEYIDDLIDARNLDKNKIIGIGLTMPGFVDVIKGVNYTFNNLAENSVVDHIQQQLHIPVFIENDSTAIAHAEQKFGLAAHSKNVMVINLGWGIGLGMILNDQIFRGDNGLAGEFSHLPLFKNGKLCDCGKHGCLETEASFIAIENYAKEAVAQGEITSLAKLPEINAFNIIDHALAGDRFAVKLISDAAYNVGQGLAILIHLMNPGIIVLSGKGAVGGKLWLAPVQQALNEHCIPRLTGFTDISISGFSDRAQLLGGAVMVIESIGKPLSEKLYALNTEYVI